MISGLAGILGGRRRTPGNAVYQAWVDAVDAAGGTYEADSKAIALELVEQLQAWTGYPDLVYCLPLLGANLTAARVPLIDVLNVGIAANVNFVGGDFSQATGLQGNGIDKRLDLLVTPSELGTSDSGGLGYMELQVGGVVGSWAIGSRDTTIIAISLRTVPNGGAQGWYGDANTVTTDGAAATNSHYYMQRASSNDRKFYKDGTQVATDTDNVAAGAAAGANIMLMSMDTEAGIYYEGRCGCAYLTNGTLTGTEIADLHTLLDTYLITATGR